MMRKRSLGLCLGETLAGVVLEKREGQPRVKDWYREPVETDHQKGRVENLLQSLDHGLKRLRPLSGAEDRVCLSLPENAGRVLLASVPELPRKREAASATLRWHLREKLAGNPETWHLSYQILPSGDEPMKRVLVALVPKAHLVQLQAVSAQNGFAVEKISFQSLDLWGFWARRWPHKERGLLVGWEQDSVLWILFAEGALMAYRSLFRRFTPDQLVAETRRVMADWGVQEEGTPLFLHQGMPETMDGTGMNPETSLPFERLDSASEGAALTAGCDLSWQDAMATPVSAAEGVFRGGWR